MEKNVVLPKMGNQSDSAVIVAWNKSVGETVKKGEVLVEVETDKVVSELESSDSGVLTKIFYEEGDSAPFDSVIAVIKQEEK